MAGPSTAGLNETAGVLVVSMDKTSILTKSGLQVGDNIVAGEEKELKNVSDLIKYYQNNNWKGKLSLTIFRNQKEISITVLTK